METFCNKCFKFAKDEQNLKFVIWRCYHVACFGCATKFQPDVCVICQTQSKSTSFDSFFDKHDPVFLYNRFANSIRIKHKQQDVLFDFYYNRLPEEIKKSEDRVATKQRILEERKQKIKKMEEEAKKMKIYVDYYEKYFKNTNRERQSFLEGSSRPKTPNIAFSSNSASETILSEINSSKWFTGLK